MEGMRILITGGAGFIGSNLAERLADANNVTILDNLYGGRMENLLAIRDRVRIVKDDIRNPETVRREVNEADYVFHMAAQISSNESIRNPLENNDININGTLNILSAAADSDVKRMVFASSSSVYAPGEPAARSEDSETVAYSPYSFSKLAGEGYCRLYSKLYGLDTVSLRYFSIYGPRQHPTTEYIPKFVNKIIDGVGPVIYGNPDSRREYTYVADSIDATLSAAEAKGISGQVFNIGSGNKASPLELFGMLCDLLGKEMKPKVSGMRQGDRDMGFSADISKARRLLGYSPRWSLKDGLKATVESVIGERKNGFY